MDLKGWRNREYSAQSKGETAGRADSKRPCPIEVTETETKIGNLLLIEYLRE